MNSLARKFLPLSSVAPQTTVSLLRTRGVSAVTARPFAQQAGRSPIPLPPDPLKFFETDFGLRVSASHQEIS